jgi:hypothetical protein
MPQFGAYSQTIGAQGQVSFRIAKYHEAFLNMGEEVKTFIRWFFVGMLLIVSTGSLAENFSVHDQDGNYSYGKIKQGGKVEMYDQNGNYSYGKVKEGGKLEVYDQNGNYSYGKIKEGGRIELYDQDGNYSYGKTR